MTKTLRGSLISPALTAVAVTREAKAHPDTEYKVVGCNPAALEYCLSGMPVVSYRVGATDVVVKAQ